MKKTSSMSKNSSNLSKSRFGCYFRRSLVNFKNLIIIFWNIGYAWFVKYLCCERGVLFDSEHIKNDS